MGQTVVSAGDGGRESWGEGGCGMRAGSGCDWNVGDVAASSASPASGCALSLRSDCCLGCVGESVRARMAAQGRMGEALGVVCPQVRKM